MKAAGFLKRLRAVPLMTMVCLAACASAGGSGETLIFDPALGVDLAAMKHSPTGLYTRDLTTGAGAPASDGDRVRVRYTLFLTNGKRIEGIDAADPPFEFRIGPHEVIAGWIEGVTGMRVGGRRQLVIPPSLGYGVHARGEIPASSVMVVTIELVEIVH